jgi:transcriptional regulator with XRE-family HTH domain
MSSSGTELVEIVGHRIKKIRKIKGFTQDEMVKYLHCGRSNFSKIESGQVMPGGLMLSALHEKLNVSLDWLFTGLGPMFYELTNYDFGPYQSDVRDMLKDMSEYKALKHSLLSHYYNYKAQYKSLLTLVDAGEEERPVFL